MFCRLIKGAGPHLLCNQQNLHALFAEIATREGGEDFLGEKRSCKPAVCLHP